MTKISYMVVQFTLLALLVVGGSSASLASASEITGTLSSDGSTETTSGSSAGTSEEATIMSVNGERTLSGTVVSGMDSTEGNSAALTVLLWSLPSVLLALVLLSIYWRKRSI